MQRSAKADDRDSIIELQNAEIVILEFIAIPALMHDWGRTSA
jgi:hypothetical protein